MIKKYRKESKNLNALKGKLEFAGHIRHNLIHKERFYTTHQVYDKDHLLHQILFVALEIVKQFTYGTRLSDLCNRVMFDFPEVKRIKVNEQLLSGVRLNRKSNSYSYSLELARLIILNYSPDISKGKTRMLSLLFDMNKLWEEYVLSEMRKIQDDEGISVEGQEERDFWGDNYLKPDIIIVKDKKSYVIDTKWKRPGSSPSIGDLRQMYAYARFWNAEHVLLLYPGNKRRKFKNFLTDDYHKQDDETMKLEHKCKMGFVSILNESNDGLRDDLGKEILRVLEVKYKTT